MTLIPYITLLWVIAVAILTVIASLWWVKVGLPAWNRWFLAKLDSLEDYLTNLFTRR